MISPSTNIEVDQSQRSPMIYIVDTQDFRACQNWSVKSFLKWHENGELKLMI